MATSYGWIQCLTLRNWWIILQSAGTGSCLTVQWLDSILSLQGGIGLTLGQTKSPWTVWHGQKRKKKKGGGQWCHFSFHGVFQLIHFLINTSHVVIVWFSAFWYMCRVISLWLNWGFPSEKCCWVSRVYFSAGWTLLDTAFEFFKLSSLISFHWVLWILFIFWGTSHLSDLFSSI